MQHTAPEVVLPLADEDEYGCRPAVSQDHLRCFLAEAGLPSVVADGGQRAMPEAVNALRKQAVEQCGGLAMFSLLGADLPGLVPRGLARYPVWYVTLPEEMAGRIPGLLAAKLYCYGGLTGDPWKNAVYLALTGDGERSAEPPAADQPQAELSFRPERANLSLAEQKGCVLVVLDCAGVLHLRGIPVGVEIMEELSACESSSFQHPLRVYTLENLQQRTRAVEEFGHDPEGPPSGGNIVAPVFRPAEDEDEPGWTLPPHLVSRLPPVRWCSVGSAVIGQLPNVTYFPQDCQGELRLHLKCTVVPAVYEALETMPYQVHVHCVDLVGQPGKTVYLMLLRVEDHVCVVAMDAADERFQHAYRAWAEGGECLVALENLRNGRLLKLRVHWSSPWCGVGDAGALAPELPMPSRCEMCDDAAVRRMVEATAALEQMRLVCYACDAVDETQWRAEA